MAKLKVTESEVSQEIDLNKLTGADLSQDPELTREIQQATIDYMLGRISEGKGIGGKALRSPYSKTYQASQDFEAAGKSATDVNMELSGDMLGTIDIIKESNNGAKFTFGINDPTEAIKAYGHQTGFKGHPTIPQGKYKREFFGVFEKELKENVLSQFQEDIDRLKRSRVREETSRQINQRVLQSIRTAADLFREDED
jgi:hypothetical protein